MLQHFPIRCGQPDIQFTCTFRSHGPEAQVPELRARASDPRAGHQPRTTRRTSTCSGPNATSRTGPATSPAFKVVERRFEYAPVVTFGVDLVDSLMSQRDQGLLHQAVDIMAIISPQIDAILERGARCPHHNPESNHRSRPRMARKVKVPRCRHQHHPAL